MKLRDIMSTPVLTIHRGEPASDAFALMRDERVRHAVVVSGTDVIGVLSDRDLGGSLGGLARKGRTVEDLMHRDPVVARPDTTVTEAARLVRKYGIGCLPVVDDGKLVGIVTRGDLLGALAERRRRERRRAEHGAADIPRPPLLVSPNRDKWP